MAVKGKMQNDYDMAFPADKIRNFRVQKLQCDQKQFAKMLGVSQGIISKWERGKYKPPAMALMAIGRLDHEERAWWFGQAGQDHLLVDELVETYKSQHQVNEDENKTFRIFGSAGAGPNRFTDAEAEGKLSLPRTLLPDPPSVAGLWVMDDLMAPLIRKGFLAVVDYGDRSDLEALTGAIVAVRQERGVVARWLRAIGDSHYLMTERQDAEASPQRVKQGDHSIVGRIAGWMGKTTSAGRK